jgi:hypothetical protein
MARLFITPREIDLISDITKEIHKDVIGQVVYYYSVREDVTKVHDIYEEAPEKIFDPPVEIDARVEWQAKEISTDRFGHHAVMSMTVYLHYRDVIDRGLEIREGDYLSWGDNFFEITTSKYDSILFGQIEHVTGYVLTAKTARKGQIDVQPIGPTKEIYSDPDAVQQEFTQQRGNHKTGDRRELIADDVLEAPVSGAKSVSSQGSNKSSFYGDE